MQLMYVYGGHCSGLQVLQGIQCWKHFVSLLPCNGVAGWMDELGMLGTLMQRTKSTTTMIG